ncbi:Surfactin synthase thioesterase subunit [Nocardia amikacinitolerans]|uniref:Thioesterase TesA n=1 Tax=Nocardia amikacinitolerans TaxID=756689 RepID=A0A285LTM3_9NOCA|nr:alpha/beta fold hydrolase [Nocardia amikacinitolerans]MCP2274592.1 Surfactin synthase thioesterase subunit [Nocardia amikacinitolerans]MCP2297062.1 Surfactin synthase thioesterase subunit [Nocardia amikacinitolerans]SNY88258.1 Surfactin synthase thioesterase subunit [Nocardia amikacinitolerans]
MGNSWLRRLSPSAGDGSHKLFCFPHAGGSAISFGPLAEALGTDFEVLAVQYPGRQDRRREPLVGNIPDLVDGLLPELKEAAEGAEGFSLFGHSMGSVVAFEACRRLEQESGVSARVLFASGRRAPSAALPALRVHLLSDRELGEHLLGFGGTPAALLEDPEFRQLILSVVRNDYRAIETYECSADAMVSSPVVALVGDRDPDASFAEIEAWGTHTTGSFFAKSFPGGHFFIDANRHPIGQLIRDHCARALSS